MNFMPALIAAMMAVESGGNPSMIGDGGRALGVLQIHEGVVYDVNRIYGTHYRHGDALNKAKAQKICRLYLRAYAPKKATAEQCARIWNGGPDGWQQKATREYWRKVKAEMKRRSENIQHPTSNVQCRSKRRKS